MREWTERHIRELIDDEYKRMNKNIGSGDSYIRTIDVSNYLPSFDTGGYSIGRLLMKKFYVYNTDDKDILGVEAPVISPGEFVYREVPNVYQYEGKRIVGVTLVPVKDNPPWYTVPLFDTYTHYEDLSQSGVPNLSQNHNPGIVAWTWSPFDENGNLITRAFARLRNPQGAQADFELGILDQTAISAEERTETMSGMRLGFIVPGDNTITNWDLYDWNYRDYYYPDILIPDKFCHTNTICFYYHKSFHYGVDDSYFG